MPDVQDLVSTVTLSKPASAGSPRVTAATRTAVLMSDRRVVSDIRMMNLVKVVALVGMALLCWAPVVAVLVAVID